MYLRQSRRKDGRIYLSIAKSYRENGKVKSKTVRSIGYLDQFEGVYDDPIAHFKAEAASMEETSRGSRPLGSITIDPAQKIGQAPLPHVELGAAVFSRYFNGHLKVGRFFRGRRDLHELGFNPCGAFEFMVWKAISSHASPESAWESRLSFPKKCQFTVEDMRKALSYSTGLSKELAEWIDSKSKLHCRADCDDRVFHVITTHRFAQDNNGKSSQSKNPTPFVQLGITLGQNGIPHGYNLVNEEGLEYARVWHEKSLPKDAASRRLVVIAEADLADHEPMIRNILEGKGFIFGSTARRAGSSIREWCLDVTGYEELSPGLMVKSKIARYALRMGEEPNEEKANTNLKIIALRSEEYARANALSRNRTLAKSQQIANSKTTQKRKRDARQHRKPLETSITEDAGTILQIIANLNQEAIEADAVFDGHFYLITSETDMTDGQVVEAYRNVRHIKAFFNAAEDDYDRKPPYVNRSEYIEGHFLVSYVAFVILRMLRADTDWRFTERAISEALGRINGTHLAENYYHFSYRTEVTDALGKASGVDLTRAFLTAGEIRSLMAASSE